ncbi:MAG TPA: efflux RND transporter periplasmic adaptor subunit [Vicinamibacterales bacterium]|nr:efflux RND transporter periplasmic adaptor subunit [Vicinamibacterales bacterium]
MKIVKAVAALVVITLAFGGGYVVRATRASAKASNGRKILYYVDPMHPAYKSDKPGVAPDCGMTLEPVYADEATGTSGHAGHAILYYQDPHDPRYHADKPGLNPETGNTLEPVYADATPTSKPGAIKISPERQQLIGVKFATVELSGQARSIRSVGKVTFDETRVAHVHTRIDGWIEKVFVDFTGDFVKQGQPMLTIYSPEMLASQQELLLAARARDLMRNNPLASAAEHGNSLFEAARRRLELWQLKDDQIEHVLTTGQPIHSVTLYAPASGFVTERKAFPNQKVTPDSDLYTITDLSRIWIVADVFESDITSIKIGDATYVSFPNGNTPPLAAKVTYIQPQVDPMTRTLKVRLDAPNPGLRMKPDMYVSVEFGIAGAKQLLVPAEAVLDTGDRQTVFVDLGDGYLEPRQVVVGERYGDRVAITRGLAAGERVVSSGTFLIDSESQLKAAAGGMGAPQHQHGSAPAANQPPAKPMDPSMPMPELKKPGPGGARHD